MNGFVEEEFVCYPMTNSGVDKLQWFDRDQQYGKACVISRGIRPSLVRYASLRETVGRGMGHLNGRKVEAVEFVVEKVELVAEGQSSGDFHSP